MVFDWRKDRVALCEHHCFRNAVVLEIRRLVTKLLTLPRRNPD